MAGEKITLKNGTLNVPNNPIIPFIEGDGTGPDIWRASVRVFDAAVAKAFGLGDRAAVLKRDVGPFSASTSLSAGQLIIIVLVPLALVAALAATAGFAAHPARR